MNKKSFFNTEEETKFNKRTSLATELPSSETEKTKNNAMNKEFIFSIIGTIIGFIVIILGFIVILIKDSDVPDSFIDLNFIKISAGRLTVGLVIIILGVFIIFFCKYKFKIKK